MESDLLFLNFLTTGRTSQCVVYKVMKLIVLLVEGKEPYNTAIERRSYYLKGCKSKKQCTITIIEGCLLS